MGSARLHNELDRRALFPIDLDVGKGRDADEIDAVRRDEAAGNRDGLDGLIERAGPDGLHLRTAILADHAGQSAGDRIRIRFRRNFQDFHDEHDLLVHLMLEYVSAIHAAI